MSLAHRLEKCYTGVIYDVMRAMGLSDTTLPQAIRPLLKRRRLAGPVFTVEGKLQPGLDPDFTLMEWTGMLSKVPAGSVVVMQPNDHTISHIGELTSEAMLFRGVRGFIVDGGARDTEFIEDIGFRVFCRYFTPRDVVGRWAPTALGAPITIEGVRIATGDHVVADQDGICVIPGDKAEAVTIAAEEAMRTESMVRKAILEGEDPQAAYVKYGKF